MKVFKAGIVILGVVFFLIFSSLANARNYNETAESPESNKAAVNANEVGGVTVKVIAPSAVSYGDTFEVSIEVTHVISLDTLLFKLEFNPAVIQVVPPVKKGELTSTVVEPVANIQNEQGWLKTIFNLPGTTGVSGAGSVAVIEFEAVGTNGAISELRLPEFEMGDSVPNLISIGEIIPSQVQVNEAAVDSGLDTGGGRFETITELCELLGGLDNDQDVDFEDYVLFVYYWNTNDTRGDIAGPIPTGGRPGQSPWSKTTDNS